MFSGARKAAALIVLSGIIGAAAPPPAAAAEPLLVDQNARVFTLSSLRGTPLIVTFVAASCTEACPLINAQFAQTQAAFKRQRLNARLLTITLDPRNDTPRVMRVLAQRFGADPHRWLLASGSVRNVQRVLDAFGVRTGDDHTTFVYVFDANGVLHDRLLASSVLQAQLAGELHAMSARGGR
ncbi:MAG TPA: SCO family protein [Candidatus Baltobacteraceae bacterium]|nr:SCO family protein [Candidatus Baltobacteraceae bacterium]